MSILGILDSVKWLTVFDMILCLLNLGVLIGYAIPIKKYYRWFDFLPSLGVIIAIISIIYGDTSYLAIGIYSLTLIIFLSTVKKVFKPTYSIPVPKHRILRVILCACGVITIVVVLMIAGEIRYNPVSDLSNMSYSKAFVQMNERLSIEYPFGDWKKINWNELKNKYEPIFEKAEKDKDKDLYYKTLKSYVCSIRDGHVTLMNMEQLKNEFGGGFGIRATRLDDGTIVVNSVIKDSPAERSGIKIGAELLTWDQKDGKEVFKNTSCNLTSAATDQAKFYSQGIFMGRAPIGKEIQVEFKNMDEKEVKKAVLQAYDDQFQTLKSSSRDQAPIEGKLLDNGYGYVKINYFPMTFFSKPEKVLEEKLKLFQDKKIKGLILDLRDNKGGYDQLVAKIAGYFVKEEKFYEYTSYYNRFTKKFEINYSETRKIKPAKPYFDGKIAILINSQTASSGEGLPLVLKEMPNVKIIGFTGTNGSFGMVTSPIKIKMPEGYLIQLPDGRSLNKDKVIQGDSDYSGRGGVAPDTKVPLNKETFKEKYISGQDVELDYAIEALK